MTLPIRALLVYVAVLVLAAMAAAQGRPAAEVIVTNAKVWTGEKERPAAEAVAILGERIVAVGTAEELDGWRGPETKVIDGRGKLLVPGFNDAHTHFVAGGARLDEVALKDATSAQEFARRIEARAKERPGEWILGGGWDEQKWSPAELPTRHLIDAVTATTPVFVTRYDGHMGLANTAALRLAKITRATPDPPGGEIVRDAQGNPTGVLRDAAMTLVRKVVPEPTHAQRMEMIRRAMRHAAELGVTSVQEMYDLGESSDTEFRNIAAFAELAERGELTVRVYVAPTEVRYKELAETGVRRAFGPAWLRIGAVKGYVDGSLGSSTAYFHEAYNDAPGKRGLLSETMRPLTRARGRLLEADKAGLQLCMHAIGDAGIGLALELFGDVVKANGERDRRLRIEHAQHIAAKDFRRFAELKLIASVQPYHAIDDGRWAEKRIGERIRTTYAFRSLLDHGVRLALGTDWYVAPLSPMETLYAAVTRATLDGKNPQGWVAEEKISVAEALAAYTAGSAYAEFQDEVKGTIAAGKLADMVLLSDDIFSIRPEALREVKVEWTMVGGKMVWERKE